MLLRFLCAVICTLSALAAPRLSDDTTCLLEESRCLVLKFGDRVVYGWVANCTEIPIECGSFGKIYRMMGVPPRLLLLLTVQACTWLHQLCNPFRWFAAEDHILDLQKFLVKFRNSKKKIQVLDVFGVSRQMTAAFERGGWSGFSYDIKLCRSHDICSESGLKLLFQKACESLHSH